jgi:hypothetical protein
MRREKTPVTVAAVARRAAVSRTFIYTSTDARTAVADAATASDIRQADDRAAQDVEHEATWRERALNAEDALKAATAEIVQQRARIGELLGQVRDLEAEWTQEAIQRITTENTPSSSEYGNSPPTTGPWTNDSRRPGRTCGSRTAAPPTSRPSSQIPLP